MEIRQFERHSKTGLDDLFYSYYSHWLYTLQTYTSGNFSEVTSSENKKSVDDTDFTD